MDIWEWLRDEAMRLTREGHGRLARGLMRLPSLVCDDRHAETDALVPELLAGARSLCLAWLEVAVRHCDQRSSALHGSEGQRGGAEVESLVDFAQHDANRSCHQSLCSVDYLTVCYAKTAGPAYAEER